MNPIRKILGNDVSKNATNLYLEKKAYSKSTYGREKGMSTGHSAYTIIDKNTIKKSRKNIDYPKKVFLTPLAYNSNFPEKNNIESISSSLEHEEIHHAIASVAGMRATKAYDNISDDLEYKEAYYNYRSKYGKVAADKAFGLR